MPTITILVATLPCDSEVALQSIVWPGASNISRHLKGQCAGVAVISWWTVNSSNIIPRVLGGRTVSSLEWPSRRATDIAVDTFANVT